MGKLGGAALQIVEVPFAFAGPPEEARHAVFEHLAARRKQAGAGRDPAASGNRSFSSPPVPCSRNSGRLAGCGRRDESMDEAEIV